jgi:catechol 2,3-dioxygenase-like lactoylglutathione lyase family enzyme
VKRFHAHVAVDNLAASVDFYSKLFGQPPSRRRDDYAKWMLEDPRINFALSARGHAAGLNHFGVQAESPEELAELKARADAAAPGQVSSQEGAACCYAKSEKHWTLDPQGLAWEHFHTLAESDQFGGDTDHGAGACCIPIRATSEDVPADKGGCCLPNQAEGGGRDCCG